MTPCFVFVIDVSFASQKNRFLNAVFETIKDAISSGDIPQADRTKVIINDNKIAVITYDNNIHFHNLGHTDSKAMYVVSDDDLFLPTMVTIN